MTAFLSGEMRDTVAISPAGAYGKTSANKLTQLDTEVFQSSNGSSQEKNAPNYSDHGPEAQACGSKSAPDRSNARCTQSDAVSREARPFGVI